MGKSRDLGEAHGIPVLVCKGEGGCHCTPLHTEMSLEETSYEAEVLQAPLVLAPNTHWLPSLLSASGGPEGVPSAVVLSYVLSPSCTAGLLRALGECLVTHWLSYPDSTSQKEGRP